MAEGNREDGEGTVTHPGSLNNMSCKAKLFSEWGTEAVIVNAELLMKEQQSVS